MFDVSCYFNVMFIVLVKEFGCERLRFRCNCKNYCIFLGLYYNLCDIGMIKEVRYKYNL